MHLNVRSLKSKIDQLEILNLEHKFDVCCFSETHLKEEHIDVVQLDGFQKATHYSRKYKKQGGVSIHIKHDLTYFKLDWVSELAIESHFESCGICVPELSYIIICLYRAPKGNFNLFIHTLETMLIKLMRNRTNGKKLFILGDYNIDIIQHNRRSEQFLTTLKSFNMHPTFTDPTRCTSHSQTCLDNIFTNVKKYRAEILDVGISDHSALKIDLKTNLSFYERYWFVVRRNVDKYMDIFLKYISQISFSNVYNFDNPNEAFDTFIEIYTLIFELSIPVEKTKISHRKKPNWKTKGIVLSCKNKRTFYLNSISKNDTIESVKYKTYSNTLKKIIKRSKKIANIRYINRSTNKMKATWGLIKQHTAATNAIRTSIDTLKMNNTTFNEPIQIANLLVEHFSKVQNDLQSKNIHLNSNPQNCNSIFLAPVDYSEITKIVKSFKAKKTTGHDKISMQVIKKSIHIIIEPLVYIINLTLETGIFPDFLKVALIKPIHKKGAKDDANNYRPIALLSCISKIFEKVIYDRITAFFTKNGIIDDNQFGFRKGKNTSGAIFKMIKKLSEDINEKKPGIALFLDLSKAFDSVDHSTLLNKLESTGIRGNALKLIESYLSNRTQIVALDTYNRSTKTVEQIYSKSKIMSIGVPQGSILGPILFLPYINELPKLTEHLCVMFADDATIYIPKCNNVEEFNREINKTLNTVGTKLGEINLNLNVEKTKIIQFRNYKQQPTDLEILYRGNKVKVVDNTNFLGVSIDNHLNWKSHVNKVNTKLSKYCYVLAILSNISSKEIALNAYYGYVYPQLIYGVIFWGNSVEIESTFILQKRCLRTIYKLNAKDSLRNIFKSNNILTLTCIYIYEICIFVKSNSNYFFEIKSSRSEILRKKHKHNIFMPQINNSMYHNSPYIMALKIYNKLPTDIKTLVDNHFKIRLKTWLISKAYYKLIEYLND